MPCGVAVVSPTTSSSARISRCVLIPLASVRDIPWLPSASRKPDTTTRIRSPDRSNGAAGLGPAVTGAAPVGLCTRSPAAYVRAPSPSVSSMPSTGSRGNIELYLVSGVEVAKLQRVSGSASRYSVRTCAPPRIGNVRDEARVSPGCHGYAASENVEPTLGWPWNSRTCSERLPWRPRRAT